MATLNIQKVSGVISIRQDLNPPKYYFGATGKYQGADNGASILISISQAGQTVPDQYTIAYGSLTVGTSTATTLSQGLVLLNAIFGS